MVIPLVGKTKSASLTEEEGVDSIVARNENSWACDHPMEFDLTGDFDVTISTVNFRVCCVQKRIPGMTSFASKLCVLWAPFNL